MMRSYLSFLNWIETQEQSMLHMLRTWVELNTFSSNIQGLNQLLPLLQSHFHLLGGESHLMTLSPHQILVDGQFQAQPLGKALLIRKRAQAPIQILLGGHFDTVYSPHAPFQTIHENEPGIWNGPGVADMKGGIAILLFALAAVERSPLATQIGWEVLLTPDEEIGSPGSASLYETAGQRHQLGLLFEPSFPDGAFVSERKGSATYSVVIRGRAAHVGRDFEQGRSAVLALGRFIYELNTLQKNLDLTLNVADIEGKGPVNIVPPLASCRINFRSSNVDHLQQTSAALHQLAKTCEQEGIHFEIVQDSFRPPKPFDQPTQQLFDAYASCAQELKIPFQTRSTGGVCDGNILAGIGLPTLDTAGVVGGALHTPNEYVILSSLVERAKLAALFLFKLASGEVIIPKRGDA